jgi:uncharacterized repeat protein (TIGR01451 family)
MCFINQNVGCACYDTLGGVIKTVDGGNTWTLELSSIQVKFRKIFFIDELSCYAITANDEILKSNDGGQNWSACAGVLALGYSSFSDIYFKNNLEGFITGTYGRVLRTINGGATWEIDFLNEYGTGHPGMLFSSFYLESNGSSVFIIGPGGYIYKLSDRNKIKGFVYNDLNNNNIWDVNEPPIQNTLLKLVSGSLNYEANCLTDSLGKYLVLSDSGSYNLNFVNAFPYCSYSPNGYNGAFNGLGNIDSNKNFAFHFIANARDIEVYLTSLNSTARRGFEIDYQITYRNVGTEILSGNLVLKYDSTLLYLNSSPNCNSQIANSLSWNYSNLQPLESRNIIARFYIPSIAPIGDTLFNNVIAYPIVGDSTPQNNRDSLVQRINAPLDPNNKEVIPTGSVSQSDVNNGQYLTYTIHFQNIGTDTAFIVKVEDCLSENFEIASFQLLSSSFPCTWNINQDNVLDFIFTNIRLAPISIDSISSCGFVRFRIMMKKSLTIANHIDNYAQIYFDYNDNVQTNYVSTHIVSSFASIAEAPIINIENLLLYPNPTTSSTNIEYNLTQLSKVNISVYNFMGAMVTTICNEQQPAGNYKKVFKTKEFGLSAGIYFVRLSVNGKSEVKKLVVVD